MRYILWFGAGIIIVIYFGIRFLYFKPAYRTGETAPIFSAVLADGSSFRLDDLHGKYVLVEFWGSWCGPCIKHKPILKRLYEDYGTATFTDGAGFEIVSVAVEQSDARWRAALNRYDPIWPKQILDEVSNLRFFDGALTKQFGVRRLPTKFLLDPGGKIIGTNLSFDEIGNVLEESQR